MTDEAWDARERGELLQRAQRLSGQAGLKIKDGAALIEKLHATGVSIHFGHLVSDEDVTAKLRTLASDAALFEAPAAPALNGPGPKNPDFFNAWLGGLAATYDTLQPTQKLALWHKFKAGTPARATVEDELIARYGTPEAAMAKMTPMEKLRMAHSAGATVKPAPVGAIASTPAMAGMSGERRLAHLDATREATRLSRELAGLKASRGGSITVQSYRTQSIEKIEARLATLAQRGVLAA